MYAMSVMDFMGLPVTWQLFLGRFVGEKIEIGDDIAVILDVAGPIEGIRMYEKTEGIWEVIE